MKRLACLLLLSWLISAGCSSHYKGLVRVYTPFPELCAKELAKAFEKKTGIFVEMVLEGTSRVFARIRAEKSNPRADVWYGGGGMIPFITATQDDLLEPYRPAGRGEMPERRGNLILRDEQFRWVGMCVIALGYAYNPKLYTPEQIPRTWDDLADPRWKGKLEMWDPSVSGTSMLFLDASLLRYIERGEGEEKGWEYLTHIFQNLNRYTVEGKPAFNVARGESDIGIHFEHQVLEFLEEQSGGEPISATDRNIEWYLPPDSPVVVDPIALIKGCPHPDEARLFIDFVMSPEGQRIVNRFFFSIDPELPPPPNLEGWTLEKLEEHAMKLDPAWMAANFDRVRKRWQNSVEATSEDE